MILALLPVLLGDGARPPSYGEVSLGGLVGNDLPRLEWSSDPLGPWISR